MMMSTNRPTVGVVTVLYNSEAVVAPFIDSLSSQVGVRIRLYAVNNASPDDSMSFVRNSRLRSGEIIPIESGANVGIAEGNNRGIRNALRDGVDWVLLLNNDTEFPSDMVKNLVEVAEQYGRPIVTPVIEGDSPRGTVWYAGGRWMPWRGYQVVHDGWGASLEDALGSTAIAEYTQYAPTCCLLVRPDVFDRVGMMDASYFVYFDDVDFAIRARREGFEYTLTSSTTLLHKAGGATGGPQSRFTIMWDTRNWVLVARRFSQGFLKLSASLMFIWLWSCRQSLIRREPWALFRLRAQAFLQGLRADTADHSLPPAVVSK